MNINRYNYEEYFLLYLDNELSASERSAVEAFVEQHADLEEELSMLKQSLLKPDASVVMEDKSSLFKRESSSVITLENYETYFLLYVDEELDATQRRAVESFASSHPSQQQELSLLMQTRVEANESIVFPNKNLLYKVPVIGERSRLKIGRIVAVAAVLLIAVAIFWLTPGTNQMKNPGLATNKNEVKPSVTSPSNNNEKKLPQGVAQTYKQSGTTEQSNEVTRLNKQTGNQKIIQPKYNDQLNKQVAVIHTLVDSPRMKLPHMEVSHSTVLSTDALALNTKGTDNLVKTLIVDQPAEQTATASNVVLTAAEALPGEEAAPAESKNKLRGLFRQVKRVVEKTARVPGDANKKLLIGNIEIAIK